MDTLLVEGRREAVDERKEGALSPRLYPHPLFYGISILATEEPRRLQTEKGTGTLTLRVIKR